MNPPAASKDDLRPVCFMVMPFKHKQVSNAAAGAPGEVDFDLLWNRAFYPAIDALGYTPVRADADTGSMIVQDMIERLAFADLIIADISIPNGNVYYEVGVRHVARETGCVLVAADWSRQLFDIEQFRCLRYPLSSTEVSEAEAKTIQDMIVSSVPGLCTGQTPYHALTSAVDWSDPDRRGVFRDFAEKLSRFQERAAAVRLMNDEQRPAMVRALAEEFGHAFELPDVSLEMVGLFRDEVGWKETLEFIDKLPSQIQALPLVREQRLLALGNSGEPEEAIAGLEKLIEERGPDPERHGLIGGRFKRLWRESRADRIAKGEESETPAERRYLTRAIEHYTSGMQQDYNQYYCSANLPLLLRARDRRGDRERADVIEHFVIAACERAISMDSADEWVWPTLLGAAFRSGDVDKADELAGRLEGRGLPMWNLAATLDDLADIVGQTADDAVGSELQEIVERLNSILEES